MQDWKLNPKSNSISHSRISSDVDLIPDNTAKKKSLSSLVDLSDKYIYGVRFTIEIRTNSLLRTNLFKWTEKQEVLYFIVIKLYKKHKSYRKVSSILNKRKIKTFKGNTWGKSGKNVYSVLKRYKERTEQLEYLNRKYESEWSSLKLVWSLNKF
jgi:DNA gyrase/topoisomerase IV subunit A